MDPDVRTVDPARIERIIDAAAQLFAERHYHEVRMDDIAAKANVAKGTIYLHFKDKDDLYQALAISTFKNLSQKIADSLLGIDDPQTKLLALHRVVFQFFEHNAFRMNLINRVERMREQTGDASKELANLRAGFMDTLQSILEEFPEAAHMSPSETAFSVIALSGMFKEVLQNLPAPWPPDLPDRFVNLFLRGFRHLQPHQSTSHIEHPTSQASER
jgi:AcrR family transcriptional regulator